MQLLYNVWAVFFSSHILIFATAPQVSSKAIIWAVVGKLPAVIIHGRRKIFDHGRTTQYASRRQMIATKVTQNAIWVTLIATNSFGRWPAVTKVKAWRAAIIVIIIISRQLHCFRALRARYCYLRWILKFSERLVFHIRWVLRSNWRLILTNLVGMWAVLEIVRFMHGTSKAPFPLNLKSIASSHLCLTLFRNAHRNSKACKTLSGVVLATASR